MVLSPQSQNERPPFPCVPITFRTCRVVRLAAQKPRPTVGRPVRDERRDLPYRYPAASQPHPNAGTASTAAIAFHSWALCWEWDSRCRWRVATLSATSNRMPIDSFPLPCSPAKWHQRLDGTVSIRRPARGKGCASAHRDPFVFILI
jgi:hypothetical protein